MGRPPRIKKKPAASSAHGVFITRAQALRRLQLSLAQFRKLCILKGIYPREPTNKNRGNDKTYYLLKDIQFLSHDPMLPRIRERKIWKKRVTKAKGRHENDRVRRLYKLKPRIQIEHVIRERYPTFQDALRDMDDALCMLFLYSTLPAGKRAPAFAVSFARRLILEFQSWIMREKALRKVFISIKGIYYQADVNGVDITWLVPHSFAYDVPNDVDYKVMLTFLQLYETLVGFVNFKLYHQSGLHYPPLFDKDLEDSGEGLHAVILDSSQNVAPAQLKSATTPSSSNLSQGKIDDSLEANMARIASADKGEQQEMDVDETEDRREEEDVFESEDSDTRAVQNVFSGLKFFISREVPRDSLQFMILCCGGEVSWQGEGAPYPETDEGITHVIVDRPSQKHKYIDRSYIQPQWVADCINARFLLPTEDYVPGCKLPSHLSPFKDLEKTNYVPRRALEIQALKEGRSVDSIREEEDESEEEDEEEVSETEQEAQYQRELEAERRGASSMDVVEDASGKKKKSKKQLAKEEEEMQKNLQQIMIPGKKKRRLYERIKRTQAKSAKGRAHLLRKRAEFEKSGQQ